MTTDGNTVLGMTERLRPTPATVDSASTSTLPPVDRHGGMMLGVAESYATTGSRPNKMTQCKNCSPNAPTQA
jgi:hypothetical protein